MSLQHPEAAKCLKRPLVASTFGVSLTKRFILLLQHERMVKKRSPPAYFRATAHRKTGSDQISKSQGSTTLEAELAQDNATAAGSVRILRCVLERHSNWSRTTALERPFATSHSTFIHQSLSPRFHHLIFRPFFILILGLGCDFTFERAPSLSTDDHCCAGWVVRYGAED